MTLFIRRTYQLAFFVSTVATSWLAFMMFHEVGHVLAAELTGGTVSAVTIHPLQFSRTDLTHNPHPLLVGWGGPVIGSVIPLGLWLIGRAFRRPTLYLLRFLAGFCLIANGAYLFVDAFERGGDGGTLLLNGSSQCHLYLFAAFTIPLGLFLWNGLGPSFGIGSEKPPI